MPANVQARDIMECPECKGKTQIVVDYAQGSVICRNCGLILEMSCIDDSQEWRTFSDSSGPDRNRVGGTTNNMLHSGGLGTSVGFGNSRLARTHMIAVNSDNVDRTLNKGHKILRDIMDALALPDNIYTRCCQILKQMDDNGLLKGKTNYPWLLAVTYMACRQEGAGRSIKEILAAQPTVKVVACCLLLSKTYSSSVFYNPILSMGFLTLRLSCCDCGFFNDGRGRALP
ncbi:Transcription initiation factor IIB [Perkinsus olseni]|uniref:General transcription factor TFIIB n=1 Tax=Perkinsus olseni TaxID=32597 RepID=A0A7J6QFM6_PEROL|nr:Transcription initiation factor IIB [Perkinsus olseni]